MNTDRITGKGSEMKKRSEYYLTQESPFRALLIFSFPMMTGNLFQQFYTMADSIIVGRFIGEAALAAVGASAALTAVFIAIAVGGGAGALVITSNAFGRKDFTLVKESISTSLISFLILSLILAAAGYAFSERIMGLLNTPENIKSDAVLYLRIYFLGLPFLFMYNILSSVFNSLGKSRIPLFLLIFSSLLNIVLDIAAVTALGMGIAGVAWATLLSQALSAVLSFIILLKTLKVMDGRRKRLFSSSIFSSMTKIALPSIIQQTTINFGMMLVQSVVNTFGSEVLAGYSASIRIDNIVTVPLSAVGNAMSPYTAQNIGAGKKERINTGWKSALAIILSFAILICIILQIFNTDIISLFLGADGSAAAYRTGEEYLSYLGWFYGILGFAFVTGGVLRGMGKMASFTAASIANLSLRVIGAMVFAPLYGVGIVWYVVPLGWILYFSICYVSYRRLSSPFRS